MVGGVCNKKRDPDAPCKSPYVACIDPEWLVVDGFETSKNRAEVSKRAAYHSAVWHCPGTACLEDDLGSWLHIHGCVLAEAESWCAESRVCTEEGMFV